MRRLKIAVPFRLMALYFLVGTLWILFSDRALAVLAPDPATYASLQTIKGWFYVSTTSVLFGLFAYGAFKRREQLQHREETGERRYRTMIETMSEGVWTIEADDTVSYVNPAGRSMFKRELQEIIGSRLSELLRTTAVEPTSAGPASAEPDFQAIRESIQLLKSGTPCRFEAALERGDGSGLWCRISMTPRFDESGVYRGAQALVSDIQAHRDYELRIAAALAEKDAMLRELHHRVKNNLQLISSLISLRQDKLGSDDARRFFSEFLLRIRAISVAHEKMYAETERSRIDLVELINDIANEHAVYFQRQSIRFENQIEGPVPVDFEAAIPLSLAINEALLNAQIHAYPLNRPGAITIGLGRASGRLEVTIRDEGIGFDHVEGREETVGLTAIRLLIGQAGGETSIRSPLGPSGGTEVRIRF